MPFHLVRQDLLLGLVAMFEQLLNDIVSKHIRHQLKAVGLNLTEHLFLFIAVGCFQLLLDETRPVLVTTEFNDMAIDVLQKLTYSPIFHFRGEYSPSTHIACSLCCSHGTPPAMDYERPEKDHSPVAGG